MNRPMLDFMNCSASHPAKPPMMIAAIQPTPLTSMFLPSLEHRVSAATGNGLSGQYVPEGSMSMIKYPYVNRHKYEFAADCRHSVEPVRA